MLALFVTCAVALAGATSADPVADAVDVADDALVDDALTEDAPSAPPVEAPVVENEDALPPPDDAPAEENPWPWSTTIGSGIGMVPGGVVGLAGSVVGGLGLALVASGISQGGTGGICLAFLGAMAAVFAVPIFIVASIVMPIGVIIGALIGGAFGERFAWPTAVGALLGFVPAAAAAAATVAAYLILLGAASSPDPQAYNFALSGMVGAIVAAMVLALATGPVAVLGGAGLESLLRPPEELDDAPEPRDAPGRSDRAPAETTPPVAEEEPPPSTDEETPPPLLGPQMRF